MLEAWISFGILLVAQFLIFIAFAVYEKKVRGIPAVLLKAFLIGIPFGLAFDLVLGKLLGLSSYTLGFGLSFLIPNAAFSYGLFAATVLLLKQRPVYFYLSVLLITALYEIVNLYLHVWAWHFPVPVALVPVILGTGYLAGAVLVFKANKLIKSRNLT